MQYNFELESIRALECSNCVFQPLQTISWINNLGFESIDVVFEDK